MIVQLLSIYLSSMIDERLVIESVTLHFSYRHNEDYSVAAVLKLDS